MTIPLVAIAVGIALLVISLIFGSRRRPARRFQLRAEAKRAAAAYKEKKRLRIAELEADPAKRKYAEMMRRGGFWTDEQIAYEEDSSITGSCVHLQPVERAMRIAGIKTHLIQPLQIRAECSVNMDKLKTELTIASSVEYRQGFMPERHPEDNPWADLYCHVCQSRIELIASDGRGVIGTEPGTSVGGSANRVPIFEPKVDRTS